MTLIAKFHLVPRLRMSGTIPLLPLYAFSFHIKQIYLVRNVLMLLYSGMTPCRLRDRNLLRFPEKCLLPYLNPLKLVVSVFWKTLVHFFPGQPLILITSLQPQTHRWDIPHIVQTYAHVPDIYVVKLHRTLRSLAKRRKNNKTRAATTRPQNT